MPNYRRIFVPGGEFFFKVNLLDWRQSWLTENINALRAAYGYVQRRHPFETVAIYILPDHKHCIWRLPPDDDNSPMRWRLLKSGFSRSFLRRSDSRAGRRNGESGVWQRRFWAHCVRDDEDLSRHIDYIHWNPVKHGLVEDPNDWPYSTYREWFPSNHWKQEFGRPVNTPPDDWLPVHLGERRRCIATTA
ncbi:MAG: transposase [Pseudomonadota bacterium]